MEQRIVWRIIAGVLAGAAWCAGEMYDDVSVTARGGGHGVLSHGYIECRFVVHNHHHKQARTVRIALGEPGGFDLLHEVARTMRVEPLTQVECVLWVPPWPGNARGAKISIDGVPQTKEVDIHIGRLHRVYPVLYVSRGINRDDVEKKLYPKNGSSSSYYSQEGMIARSDEEVAQWPGEWLSYTPYDGIMVHAREWREAPEAVQEAVREYVYAGGMLWLVGTNRLPGWGLVRQEGEGRTGAWQMAWGAAVNTGGAYGTAGFGTVLALPASDPKEFRSNLVSFLRRQLKKNADVWDVPRDLEQLHARFPVARAITVPFRWLLGLSVMFAAVIGPVNILVLHRLKRRIWLLWTTPALAGLATAGVVVYALVSEGTRPVLRMSSVTLLDQRTHHAVTAGTIGYYFPMVPGGGFEFERTTEISPAASTRYRARSTGPVIMDWTRGQHVAGRLARARIPLYLRQRGAGVRRERMVFTARGGGVDALNGLGAPVKLLWYAGADGSVWYASNIVAGATARLERKEMAPARGTLLLLPMLLSGYWETMAGEIAKEAPKYLEPGTYIAVLNDDPFFDTGYRGAVRERRAESVVIGVTEGGQNE